MRSAAYDAYVLTPVGDSHSSELRTTRIQSAPRARTSAEPLRANQNEGGRCSPRARFERGTSTDDRLQTTTMGAAMSDQTLSPSVSASTNAVSTSRARAIMALLSGTPIVRATAKEKTVREHAAGSIETYKPAQKPGERREKQRVLNSQCNVDDLRWGSATACRRVCAQRARAHQKPN